MLITLIKRIYSFAVLTSFFSISLVIVVFIRPWIFITEGFTEINPERMRRIIKFFFKVLLFFLSIGRILKIDRVKGDCLDGPCVVIANHPGLLDVIFLITLIPEMSVLAKRGLVRKPFLGKIIRSAGYIMSSDSRKGSPLKTSRKILDLLKRGEKFMIFPEATRSPIGGLGAFSPGAFKLAQRAGVPIQPVCIKSLPEFLPGGVPWYWANRKVSKVEIEFLDVIEPPERGNESSCAEKMEILYKEKLNY